MAEESFEVVEWKIDNICSWTSRVHPYSIGPIHNKKCDIMLYPRGLDGTDPHISIQIKYLTTPVCLSGELALLGPDGFLFHLHLFTEVIHEVFQGPKFKDVVAHIKSCEPVHKDYITVQCRFKSAYNCVHKMTSTIDISETTLKVDPRSILNLRAEEDSSEIIGYIKCLNAQFGLHLKVDLVDERMIFTIAADLDKTSSGHYLIQFSIVFINKDNNVINKGYYKNVLYDGKSAPDNHLYTLRTEELAEDEIHSLIFKFKFINEKIWQCHNQVICYAHGLSPVLKEKSNDADKPFSSVLSKDLLCLFQEQKYSDFELTCKGVSFHVHRSILSARSPVFQRLFLCNMKEAASGKVDIVDLDPPTLNLFLNHLYSGTVNDMQLDSCFDLYYAGDKYDVPTLKTECASFLRANVSLSNVCAILSLANKYQDELLIETAHVFILRNFEEISGSDEWRSFMESETLLAAKTLTHFAQKKYINSAKFNYVPIDKNMEE